MKILFIMYSYLPQGSAEINLITKTTKKLKTKDITISILTTKSDINQENTSIIDNTTVYRIYYGRNYSIRHIKCSLFKKVRIIIDKIFDVLSYKIFKKTFLNKYLVKKIKSAFKKYQLYDFDLYIPVAGYFEMFEATKQALKRCNKKIMLYQLDPITNNTGYSSNTLKYRKNFEIALASECSGIIATQYLIEQKKKLNINIDNCYSFEFPNVDKNLNCSNVKDNKDDKIKIALFAGTLDFNVRDPRFTLELFSKLNGNIKLQIAGNGCVDIIQFYVETYPNRFEYLGVLNAEEMKKKILDADFLVNIGNNNINFVPSKIFEYISTGKPIINTCKYNECPTIQYLNDYFDGSISIIETATVNETQIKELNNFIDTKFTLHIQYDDIERVYKKYTADYIADELYEVFLNMIKEKL